MIKIIGTKKWFYLSLLMLCISFFIINNMIPLLSDDLLYQFVCTDYDASLFSLRDMPITSYHDIYQSQYNHYFAHTGRIPVHICVQLFCALYGKTAFSVITSVMLFALIFILGKCTFIKHSNIFLYYLPFTTLFLFILQPNCFYCLIACGVNYLWTSVLCLTFWYLFVMKKGFTKYESVIVLFVAFFAGWSNESIVIPLSIAVGLYYVCNLRKISLLHHFAFYTFVLGTSLLVFAPGNFVREGNGISFSFDSFIDFIMLEHILWIYVITCIICYFWKSDSFISWVKLPQNLSLNLGVIIAFVMFSYLGPIASRVGFGIDLLSVVLLWSLSDYILTIKNTRVVGAISYSIILSCFIVVIYLQNISTKNIKGVISQIENCELSECTIKMNYTPIKRPFKKFVTQFDNSNEIIVSWYTSVWQWYYKKDKITISENK